MVENTKIVHKMLVLPPVSLLDDEELERYADEAYRPSITMTEKSISKKQAKENVNNIIEQVWHDIGDEWDWDWYKKMKKKDVISYVEDRVMDRRWEMRKEWYNDWLEWAEVQKLIKKFVNERMKK